MTSSQKRKGDTWEAAVRDYLQTHGFPWTERTRAGYERDWGDLHLVPTRAVIAQAKNHQRIDLPGWLDELAHQVTESGAAHGFLAVKRRGVGDPGRSYAVLEVAALARLLREAGYGSPLDDRCPDTCDGPECDHPPHIGGACPACAEAHYATHEVTA
jgi:hypothetical protein